MRLRRHIAYTLIICFSSFLGHNMVPHYHHAYVYHSPITTSCPYEHGDHHGHKHDHDSSTVPEEHPTHCHAFNDVVFQKHSAPALRPWTGSMQTLLVPGISSLPEETQYSSPHRYTVLKLPCRAGIFPGLRGLRAPPFSA